MDAVHNCTGYPILSLVTFVPLIGAAILLFVKNATAARWIALIFTVVDFLIAIPLVLNFDRTTYQMQFVEHYLWIPSWNITYHLGIDGISVLFVFLAALLGWICVLASWKAIDKKVKEFMIAILVMQTAMIGVFCALDFFLFYLFWEAMLIPMYLIIGVWGGKDRIYAAIKFFLYTLAGSIFMLIGIIVLYFTGGQTFDIMALMSQKYAMNIQIWVFLAFFIAFAIKVPMFPFHTWLPDAHVQAPTAGSIILAGVLLKMGTYGMLRFPMPMFPDASKYFATPILILSVVGIVYGGFLALAQTDIKKLVAYSSVSHMGFVTLGLFVYNTMGIEGGIMQMFNHGISTSALFLCIGVIYERTHTRELSDYGGLSKAVPIYTFFFTIFMLSSLAIPGTNGFIGEIMVLAGTFRYNSIIAAISIIGAVMGAVYLLSMYRKFAIGEITNHHIKEAHDIGGREIIAMVGLAIFVFWIGLNSKPFLDIMHVSVGHLLDQMNAVSSNIAAIK
ncbi:MAG: NADH-quinone oxidoreductase subunit M [Nitrospirae bacterium]|nr:NADH-quinone oxidoreductase subunit M [Nitrospirota bacterium]